MGTRVGQEQGMKAYWAGNFTNCVRYFPTQAFNLAFKDTIKGLFPKYNAKTEFWPFFGVNLASGGLAGAGSLCFVYPLDYACTRSTRTSPSSALPPSGLSPSSPSSCPAS